MKKVQVLTNTDTVMTRMKHAQICTGVQKQEGEEHVIQSKFEFLKIQTIKKNPHSNAQVYHFQSSNAAKHTFFKYKYCGPHREMKREPKKERENDVNINQKTQTHACTHTL